MKQNDVHKLYILGGETTWGTKRLGAKRLVGAKRLGGKRLGGKRLGGKMTRGRNGLGVKRPGFLGNTVYRIFFPVQVRAEQTDPRKGRFGRE